MENYLFVFVHSRSWLFTWQHFISSHRQPVFREVSRDGIWHRAVRCVHWKFRFPFDDRMYSKQLRPLRLFPDSRRSVPECLSSLPDSEVTPVDRVP